MNGKHIAAYGSWQSPISADLLAKAGVRLGWLHIEGEDVYWVEMRPEEDGRYVIVRRTPEGRVTDVTPEGYNARTTVHEYGGGMYAVYGDMVIFANFDDQCLYRQDGGGEPVRLTAEPDFERGTRYADMRVTPDGAALVAVREHHEPGFEAVNEIVMLPVDGSAEPWVLASGADFYAAPRLSPDGQRLAWLQWNHPNMPWDGTELWTARLAADGSLSNAALVAGGVAESIFQPEWSPEGVLHFASDRSDWWNLYRVVDGQVEPVLEMDAEFGQPHWVFDLSRYTFLLDGSIAAIYSQDGMDYLALLRGPGEPLYRLESEHTVLGTLRASGDTLWFIGGSPTRGEAVVSYHLPTGTETRIERGFKPDIPASFYSTPQPIEFLTEDGLTAHAFYYPPTNPDYQAPSIEKPPLIVISHGGPTSHARPMLSLGIQYWTSRGFGVVDVNYGGSVGYGREYRNRLRGQWGVVDVLDCMNAASYLAAQGIVDRNRLVVRGGSAGGYTTLSALVFHDFFAAGASYFGLAELETFVGDTHKFESRYLDSLIGPYPAEQSLYYNRSPVNFADRINCPVILFQGLEDRVVPPSQAEIMIEALEAKGLPYAYIAYEGEQHGFRKAKNIRRSAEAELYFYSKVLGFDLAEDVEPVEIHNL